LSPCCCWLHRSWSLHSFLALLPLVLNTKAALVIQPGAAQPGLEHPEQIPREEGVACSYSQVPRRAPAARPSRAMPCGPWPAMGVQGAGGGSGVTCPTDSLPSLGKLRLVSTFSLWHRCRLFLVGL